MSQETLPLKSTKDAFGTAINAFFTACVANCEVRVFMRPDVEALSLKEVGRIRYTGPSRQDAVYFTDDPRSYAIHMDIVREDGSVGGYGVLLPDTEQNVSKLHNFVRHLPGSRDATSFVKGFLNLAPAELRPHLAEAEFWEFDLTDDLGLPEMSYRTSERVGIVTSPAKVFGDQGAIELLAV